LGGVFDFRGKAKELYIKVGVDVGFAVYCSGNVCIGKMVSREFHQKNER
jgi:hypothetical protein